MFNKHLGMTAVCVKQMTYEHKDIGFINGLNCLLAKEKLPYVCQTRLNLLCVKVSVKREREIVDM